jgi:hypothetical protein
MDQVRTMQKDVNGRLAKSSLFDFNLRVKFWQTFKKVALPLFILTVISTSLDQWITMQMENHLMNPNGTSPWVWVYGALSLAVSLIFPLLGTLLVLSTLRGASPLGFVTQNLNQSLIETLRAWGRVMLWSLLLILPGIYKFLQYLFIPFIVCLDPQYQRGEKDALQTARHLSHGRMLKLFLVVFLFSGVGPLLLAAFDDSKVLWRTPLPALLLCLIEMTWNLCFIFVLWKMYQRSVGHEPSLSMERH